MLLYIGIVSYRYHNGFLTIDWLITSRAAIRYRLFITVSRLRSQIQDRTYQIKYDKKTTNFFLGGGSNRTSSSYKTSIMIYNKLTSRVFKCALIKLATI